mmetsp:Transcript_8470/g.14409  ORF Transcript_8470/g.14409 Transcript_8470/m.14409 type:complete len:236 (-) Transcript_8470:175-882(-)
MVYSPIAIAAATTLLARGGANQVVNDALQCQGGGDNKNNDDDDDMMMMDDIMKVDEQIGSNFLSDDLFGHCPSPVTPQEELYGSCDYYYYSNSNSSCSSQDKMGSSAMLMTPPLSPEYPTRVTLPPITAATPGSSSSDCNTEEYRQAFFNLMESMKKSQETRVSLTMKSSKATDAYERRKSVRDVLSSIEQSRCQIEQCFGSHLASTSSPLLLSSSSSSFSSSSKDVLDAIMTEQ